MVGPISPLLLLEGKALAECNGLVVQRTHWDVFAFNWIDHYIRVEVLVGGRYADWDFLDGSGLLELYAGVMIRRKSAIAGEEGL